MKKQVFTVDGVVGVGQPHLLYSNKGEDYFMCDISVNSTSSEDVPFELLILTRDEEKIYLEEFGLMKNRFGAKYEGNISCGEGLIEFSKLIVGANDVVYIRITSGKDTTLNYNVTGDRVKDIRVSKSGSLFNGPIYSDITSEIFRQAVGMSSYATIVLDIFSPKDRKDITPLKLYVSTYEEPEEKDLLMTVVPGKHNFEMKSGLSKYNGSSRSKHNVMRVTIPVLKQHERILARTDTNVVYYIAARGVVKKSVEELQDE